ncbi:MAG: hypothetical protein WHV67_04180 [Thermoanaerobaculia bacterium]
MIFIIFYFLIFSNSPFITLQETFEKVRKADTLYELKMDLDYYKREIERVKVENNIEEAKKLKEKLDFEFNKFLKAKYLQVLKIIEENPSFFELQGSWEDFKRYSQEMELKIVERENLQDFNREILEKFNALCKTFKDPCPEYLQKAESSINVGVKIESFCVISKSPCIFSSEIKEYSKLKMEEFKLNLFSSLRSKETGKIENLAPPLIKCFEGEGFFKKELDEIKKELLGQLEGYFEKRDCPNAEKIIRVLKLIKEDKVPLEKFSNVCKREENLNSGKKERENLTETKLKKEDIEGDLMKEEPYIILDIWQSAWGDFSDLSLLIDYIKKNKISEINLNIGREITEKKESEEKFKSILKSIVPNLYNAGIKKVNLLYAELNYPIERYARFLSLNREIGIDKIVDDSEFTDKNFQNYVNNFYSTKNYQIKYSTFVTLEREGNSGVSDRSRFELIEKADEVILMSYFSCNLEEQKKWLEPYFEYSDKMGKQKNLKVAILFGSKSVGRELSCQGLEKESLRQFIFGLHNWALGFSSYSGIVFETNKKLPPNIY